MQFLVAHRAFVLAGDQRRFAERTERLGGGWWQHAGQEECRLLFETADQSAGRDVVAQGIAPECQARVLVAEFEAADAGVVAPGEDEPRA